MTSLNSDLQGKGVRSTDGYTLFDLLWDLVLHASWLPSEEPKRLAYLRVLTDLESVNVFGNLAAQTKEEAK